MVRLTWTTTAYDSVILVEVLVENTTTVAQRVRIANRLDGPVRPPRQRGVPEAGWDDGGFEGVVDPGGTVALGYASDGRVDGPPVELVWTERAATEQRERESEHPDLPVDIEASPAGVVRTLGDPLPPADAVPVPDPRPEREVSLPDDVDSWLASVEERLDEWETLADAETVSDDARELDQYGGVATVERLDERLTTDGATLRAAEQRIRAIRDRIDGMAEAVSVEAYERLA